MIIQTDLGRHHAGNMCSFERETLQVCHLAIATPRKSIEPGPPNDIPSVDAAEPHIVAALSAPMPHIMPAETSAVAQLDKDPREHHDAEAVWWQELCCKILERCWQPDSES